MRNIILTACIVLMAAACKKSDSSNTTAQQPKPGYDHSTPEGILLTELTQGSNKLLTSESFSYYTATGASLGTFNEFVPANIYLLFDASISYNPKYIAAATSTSGSPIINNTGSEVHVDSGVDYLYYDPNPTNATNLPVIHVKFTLSGDLKTLTLVFSDTTAGTATEGTKTINYASRTRTYTFVGL